MGLLLYKSNEMFSATELIRKSKMIFDKIVDDEIDKAVILRDGKPGFMLMEFEKYEKIMNEYEQLKAYVEKQKEKTKNKEKSKKTIAQETSVQVIKETVQEENLTEIEKKVLEENHQEQLKAKKADPKIQEQIEQARAQREKLTSEEKKLEKEDLKEELQLQVKLKESNKKKERELKEFWD